MVNNISANTNVNRLYAKKQVQKEENQSQQAAAEQKNLAPYNSAYVTPFINTNGVQHTQNEKDFMAYRDKFCEVLSAVATEYNKADWEFYINSTPENANTLNIISSQYSSVFKDEEAYGKFKEMNEKGIKDEHLQSHMNQLLGSFERVLGINQPQQSSQSNGETVSENQISQIFNGFKPQIDGKNVTEKEIQDILKNSTDVELRKKAYIAEQSSGDAIADKMIQLVKQRNEYAKANGYNTYYEMMLEKYGTSQEKLTKLLNDLDEKSDAAYKKLTAKNNQKICEKFGITEEEIRPWHKGLLQADNPIKMADEYFTTDNLVPIATEMYTKMGWPIDKMPIGMDLFPRDNKNGHGFCFQIEAGKDARILANLYGDKSSMETLLHESGHAVYDLGLPLSLPFFDRNPASSVMTESVAMLMESLPEREGIYAKQIGMPKELNDKLEEKRISNLTGFVKSYVFYANFEKELYENPDQDVKKLWFDLKQKHIGANPPDELNNEWATVPHFLSHPGYLQNYLRAEVMGAQIYEAAHEKIGCDLSDTTETAKFFQENIFQYGSSKSEDEIMKIATGKELDAEAFCRQLEKINV